MCNVLNWARHQRPVRRQLRMWRSSPSRASLACSILLVRLFCAQVWPKVPLVSAAGLLQLPWKESCMGMLV